ncbi:unnamed protein product, partial [Thelazia callipaeda]|uniref:Transmembrane domain-containing protein n=1 Tax=Thelazia callipaeda TaxID=103827 RepID=A0A0N5CPS4_THECL
IKFKTFNDISSFAWNKSTITTWLTACILLYASDLICILANIYGLCKSQPLWMIPKLILTLLIILIGFISTCVMGFLIWNESYLLRLLFADKQYIEYYTKKSTMLLIGGGIFLGCFFVSVLQCLSLKVLLNCFEYVQEIHIEKLTDKINRQEQLLIKQQQQQYENNCLSKEMVSMDEIAMIVITSAHPNNVGNLNLFPQKPILFHTMEYTGEHATVTELVNRPYRKLTENIEIWKTPGRTQQSLSVLVHNVEEYGTIGVVGDLIPTENYIISKVLFVWDSLIRRQNSNLIICLADWIIPGYGHPFRVLPRYRQRAGCTRLLAQRKAAGKM